MPVGEYHETSGFFLDFFGREGSMGWPAWKIFCSHIQKKIVMLLNASLLKLFLCFGMLVSCRIKTGCFLSFLRVSEVLRGETCCIWTIRWHTSLERLCKKTRRRGKLKVSALYYNRPFPVQGEVILKKGCVSSSKQHDMLQHVSFDCLHINIAHYERRRHWTLMAGRVLFYLKSNLPRNTPFNYCAFICKCERNVRFPVVGCSLVFAPSSGDVSLRHTAPLRNSATVCLVWPSLNAWIKKNRIP